LEAHADYIIIATSKTRSCGLCSLYKVGSRISKKEIQLCHVISGNWEHAMKARANCRNRDICQNNDFAHLLPK